jgi:hypothetical protein
MDYDKNVVFIINIINNVLLKYKEEPILENKKFKVYNELVFSNYLRLYTIDKECVSIMFEITNNGLRIDIDKAEEIIYYDIGYIYNNETEVMRILNVIFTYICIVTYCGKSYTHISFVSPNKEVVEYQYMTDILPPLIKNCICLFKKKYKRRVYKPVV